MSRAQPITSRTMVQHCLLVSLVRVPEAHEWRQVRQEMLDAVAQHAPHGVVLDLAQADVLDEHDLKAILDTRATVRLMGLSMVLCGLRPEVVHAWSRLTHLPTDLLGFAMVQDAIDALEHARP